MERRRDPKTLPQTQTYQERRRSEALEKQKHARDRALSRSRQLLAGAAGAESPPPPPPAAAAAGGPPAPRGGGRRASGRAPRHEDAARQRWAGQLMLPEWLVEAPADLAAAWYVLPRPEGQRCLVVAARGQTVARLPGGAELERFASALPAGAPGGGGGEGCVLDCVRHEGDGTYYVLGAEGVGIGRGCCYLDVDVGCILSACAVTLDVRWGGRAGAAPVGACLPRPNGRLY
jgi:snurportin-1